MKNTLLGVVVVTALGICNASYAETATGSAETTASIGGSCLLEVDDLAFGDVTFQTMNGSGDVTASTDLRLLCTKNAPVTLTSTGSGTAAQEYPAYDVALSGSADYYLENTHREYDASGNLISETLHTGSFTAANLQGALNDWVDYVMTGQGGYVSQTYKIDTGTNTMNYSRTSVDGTRHTETYQVLAVSPGTTTPLADQSSYFTYTPMPGQYAAYGVSGIYTAMTNGTDMIAYDLSMTSDFQEVLGDVESNGITYDQNDGQFQTFPLYGRANVQHAKPGVYVDTNTITVHF